MTNSYEKFLGEHTLDFVPRTDVRHPFDNDASGVCFGIDGKVYFCFEDPCDGYRSSAGPVMEFLGSAHSIGGFRPEYLRMKVIGSHRADYKGRFGGESDVIEFRDAASGQVVFTLGTENTDDYYPYFLCTWTPLKPQT